ncbi:hypothetical protein ACS0TY_033494 [Phlomoides rotata]
MTIGAGEDQKELESRGYACDVAENSIVCVSNGAVTIDTHKNISIYTSSIDTVGEETSVKPYALQKDAYLLQYITPVKILQGSKAPTCQHRHQLPALIFSSGITNNLFHEFNDIIIPLFITVQHFQSQLHIILKDYNSTFVNKYSKIFSQLTSYEVMNAANAGVHCFQGFILGLKSHNTLALNSSDIPGGLTTRDFRLFLGETYNLKFKHVSQIKKPTLMLLFRKKTRKFLNEEEIVGMIKGLGFKVIIARTKEASNLDQYANTINSCAVLVGAHGAGLTNELFLPDGAVLVQVEPLGLEWASANYFGNPAPGMNLHYLRYKIEAEESSLVELYGRNHSVITDIASVYKKGYRKVRAVYLKQQNVRVNIERFRKTMLQAQQLIQMHN